MKKSATVKKVSGTKPAKTEAPKSIMERVVDYKSACKEKKRRPLKLEQFAFMPDGEAFFHLHCLTTIIEALNEDEVFDYNDYDQDKCYNVFDMETYGDDAPGSGFSFGRSGYGLTASTVGVRLSVKTHELARHAAEIALPHYKKWMKK